jgi:signal transduction histidine kinase
LSLKILLAEDEPALREIFCELLTSLGYECIAASDGTEAVELARKHLPQVVVTDYMMPGCNGVEVIRAVHADPVLAGVPVILMSAGRPPEADRNIAWRFVRKPIEMSDFEALLREASESAVPVQGFTATAPSDVSPLSLAREEMLGWVSHEIKSPISAAMTASQLALRSLRNADATALIERRINQIVRQLHRMDELVNSLLDAAQLQEGKLDIEHERLDLAELLGSVLAFWRETQPDVPFEWTDESPEAVFVEGDRERLRQIFDNLLSNAVKYGLSNARNAPITVSIRTDSTHAIVGVMDRGRGIPAAELPHLFNRFHRVAGHGGRGHGLGLYIAAALSRLHGGTIVAESEPGHGSIFSLKLPLAPQIREPPS